MDRIEEELSKLKQIRQPVLIIYAGSKEYEPSLIASGFRFAFREYACKVQYLIFGCFTPNVDVIGTDKDI